VGYDAATDVFVRERKNRVCRAANFEGARFLQVFALEIEVRTGKGVEGFTGQHGRTMNSGTDALVGFDDGFPFDRSSGACGISGGHLLSVDDALAVVSAFPFAEWNGREQWMQEEFLASRTSFGMTV
jgi:hypothetical protein